MTVGLSLKDYAAEINEIGSTQFFVSDNITNKII